MIELLRTLYKWKIKVMWYFSLGYNEINSLLNLAKGIAILLGFWVLVFKFNLTSTQILVTGIVSFFILTLIGVILQKSGMMDYSTQLGNSINPEIKEILEIVKRLEKKKKKK